MAYAGKSKQEVVSEFRTGEILAAARKVFATRGFADTTVDEIASEAGIAKGTIYLYFPSKRDIYLGALKQGLLELQERTRAAIDAADGIRQKLRAFVRTRMEYSEANRDFFRIYQSEFGSLMSAPKHDDFFQQMYVTQAKMIAGALKDAIEKGEIRPIRADFVSFTIYDMVRGALMQRLMEWSSGTMEEDMETLDDLVWKGIAA